jgi:hypothetical protein
MLQIKPLSSYASGVSQSLTQNAPVAHPKFP